MALCERAEEREEEGEELLAAEKEELLEAESELEGSGEEEGDPDGLPLSVARGEGVPFAVGLVEREAVMERVRRAEALGDTVPRAPLGVLEAEGEPEGVRERDCVGEPEPEPEMVAVRVRQAEEEADPVLEKVADGTAEVEGLLDPVGVDVRVEVFVGM